MTITVEISGPAASVLAASAGPDPARTLLEAYALEGYRSQSLTQYQVQQLLGFDYFEQVHGFLKEHGVYLHYSQEDWEHDLAEARRCQLSHPHWAR